MCVSHGGGVKIGCRGERGAKVEIPCPASGRHSRHQTPVPEATDDEGEAAMRLQERGPDVMVTGLVDEASTRAAARSNARKKEQGPVGRVVDASQISAHRIVESYPNVTRPSSIVVSLR